MPTSTAPFPFLPSWDRAADLASQGLSEPVLDAARRSWFDTIAAMAAGVRENCTQAAWNAREPGPREALSTADAALVLGTASHALDYDDVCMLATCHPSAPPIAALMALLPRLPDLSWRELLAAYALGTETTLRLGDWLGFRHYALGFHATGTLGAVGAAASVAHALGLTPAQSHAALSIAASSASGLRANFGTDVKPLHVGFAAVAGLRAARLAQAGAVASDDVWGPTGFFNAFNGGEAFAAPSWQGDSAFALIDPGFEHKRFPSCYLTHRLIAGLLALHKRQPAHAGEEATIEIELPAHGNAALKYPAAATGLHGKFSGPYCAAAAWLEGRVDLTSFSDSAVLRPKLRAQMKRVAIRERDDASERLDTAPVRVKVAGEGWSDEIVVDWAPGSPANPMTRDEMRGKWRDCVRYSGLALDDQRVIRLFDAPDQTPASELLMGVRSALLDAVAHRTSAVHPVVAPEPANA